jgi:hypothetical protein
MSGVMLKLLNSVSSVPVVALADEPRTRAALRATGLPVSFVNSYSAVATKISPALMEDRFIEYTTRLTPSPGNVVISSPELPESYVAKVWETAGDVATQVKSNGTKTEIAMFLIRLPSRDLRAKHTVFETQVKGRYRKIHFF